MSHAFDSDALATHYRPRIVRVEKRELLVARLTGSEQEIDLTLPPNCQGYGRIRHFQNDGASSAWGANPLPVEPACAALALPPTTSLCAQVFQNAACNWRCWYCYVPFNLLAASESHGGWWTADALVSMYAELSDRPPIIDLTGGQPDLVPEWIPWTMDSLVARGLDREVYLWSDDNLSNDYFWKYLSEAQIEQIATWPRYGRVCCFKGFDRQSFQFNTSAYADLFERQFSLFSRLMTLGIDLYAYVTLTTPESSALSEAVPRFFDRLQALDPNLPLRTVPLEVREFTPMRRRLGGASRSAIENQWRVLEFFRAELARRFPSQMREQPIRTIPLRHRGREGLR